MSGICLIAGVVALALLVIQQARIVKLRRGQQDTRGVEASRHFAHELIEAMPCPVFYKGLDGRYIGCNDAFTRYLGKPRSKIIGRTVYDLAPKELADAYAAADAALFAQTGPQVYEVKVQWADGSRRDVVMNKATFSHAGGGVGGLIGVILDITERKRAEAKLEEANVNLEAFSRSVSHDLRTPLCAIDGFSQILLNQYKNKLDEDGQHYLELVRDGVVRMNRLINDILSFSQMSGGSIRVESVDMGALVREVFDELRAAEVERNIVLHLGDLPPAQGARALIRQVVVNLLGNAIKFTSGKTEAVIDVTGGVDGAENVYSFKDNGAGFDMERSGTLFDDFQRLHSKEEFDGTGVGLGIVKRIVVRHGGRVWAEGKVGEGAAIHFTLPRKRLDQE